MFALAKGARYECGDGNARARCFCYFSITENLIVATNAADMHILVVIASTRGSREERWCSCH